MYSFRLHKKAMLALAALALSMTSCGVDGNYDLSDVKTDAHFEAKDLVIPISISDVKLKSILDLKDEDDIKSGPDGYYVEKSGEFNADGIKVNDFSIAGKAMSLTGKSLTVASLSGNSYSLDIPDGTETEVSMSASGIDASIQSIKSLGVDTKVVIRLDFSELFPTFSEIDIKKLTLDFIPSLTATTSKGTYNEKDGKITIAGNDAIKSTDASKVYDIEIDITAIGFGTESTNFDAAQHTAAIKQKVSVS